MKSFKKIGIALLGFVLVTLLKVTPSFAYDFQTIAPTIVSTPAEAVLHGDTNSSAGKIYDVPTQLYENIQVNYYKFTVTRRSYVFLDEASGLQVTWRQGAYIYSDWGLNDNTCIRQYHDIKKTEGRYIHVYMLEPGTYYLRISNESAYKSDSSQYEENGGRSGSGRGPLTLAAKTYLHVIPLDDLVSYTKTEYACDKVVSVKFKSGYSGLVQGALYNVDVFDNDYSKLGRYFVPLSSSDNVFHFYDNVSGATYFFKITLNNPGWKDYPFFVSVDLGNIAQHSDSYIAYTEPTCSSDGFSGGIICSVCNYIKTGYVIPADPNKHILVTDPGVAATVFKTGLTDGSHCSKCGMVVKARTVILKVKPTIKLSASKKTIKVKKSFTLTVSKLANGDSIKSVKASKTSIVSIKKISKGKYKISGKKKGSTYVNVTLKSGKKAKCKVTVKE